MVESKICPKCGETKRKHSTMCDTCHDIRMMECAKEHHEKTKSGVCPECGRKLMQNITIAGTDWWQCEGITTDKCHWQSLSGHKYLARLRI